MTDLYDNEMPISDLAINYKEMKKDLIYGGYKVLFSG